MEFKESKLAKEIINFHCPRYNEFPDMGLYMEQVVEFLNANLAVFNTDPSKRLITSTMVNNYVKQKVIVPPNNKKYSRNQLVYLYVVGVLKQVLSISEIAETIKKALTLYSMEVAYTFFCVELEKSIQATFVSRDFSAPSSASVDTDFSELFRSVVFSFANKLYVTRFLQYIGCDV